MEPDTPELDRAVACRLLAIARPARVALVAGLLLMLVEAFASLLVPWLGGAFGAALLAGVRDVRGPLLLLLAAFALQALARGLGSYALATATVNVSGTLRMTLYDHLQALPVAATGSQAHGEALTLFTRDVRIVSSYVTSLVSNTLPMLVMVVTAAVMMARIDVKLALLALALIPIFFLLVRLLSRGTRPLAKRSSQADANELALVDENLGMLATLKAFSRELVESRRYAALVRKGAATVRERMRIDATAASLLQFLAAAAVVLFLWLASDRLGDGLRPEALIAFLLYGQLILRPLAGLSTLYGETHVAVDALDRLARWMDQPAESGKATATERVSLRGAVQFEQVDFAYESRPAVFDAFDLRVAEGEKVAIVGRNGAGKSTLAHLLLRLRCPQHGRITIGGLDIAHIPLATLRGQIGWVPQHVMLFNGTVRENVEYGRRGASDEDVRKALRLAGGEAMVEALPQGLSTSIGPRGNRLSGGQQQRIALARALLKEPSILVLDEATAMLDVAGEEAFLSSLRTELRECTVLIITHQSAPLVFADRVVDLDARH